MNTKGNAKTIFAWLLTIGLTLGVYCIPVSEIFTEQMRTFLVITIFAILTIALETLPKSAITILLPVAYILTGLADASLAWFPWTMPTVWMIIGALLLVNVLESSGILLRISYRIIIALGGSYKGLILGIGVLGTVLNVILFGNAYVVLAGLAYGLCQALDLKKFSKEATGIFLSAAISGIIPTIFCYGSNILMLEGIGEPVVGPMRIGYLEFTFLNIPVILYFIAALFLILIMFKADRHINGKDYFTEKLAELGVMTANEKRAAAWIVILFAYVMACGIFGWDSTWAFIIIPAMMILPGIGCGTEEDVKRLDFTFILFVASCMAIGFVAQSLGFGDLVAQLSEPMTSGASPSIVVFLVYLINVILNFLLTPMAIMAGFTTSYLHIGQAFGINPYVTYSVMLLGTDQILFPYEYALYLMYFSFGFIHMKDFVRYFGMKMILCAVMLPLIIIPFWKITGLFFM